MKVNRLGLIQMIEKNIADNKAAHTKAFKAKQDEYQVLLASHVENHGPAWAAAAATIAKAVKAHKPITKDMLVLSDNRYPTYATFTSEAPKEQPFEVPGNVAEVLSMLKMSTDETVDIVKIKSIFPLGRYV